VIKIWTLTPYREEKIKNKPHRMKNINRLKRWKRKREYILLNSYAYASYMKHLLLLSIQVNNLHQYVH